MRRALAVAIGGLVLTLLLGLWRMQTDTRQELDGALALARATERLANLATLDDAQALSELEQVSTGLRHLRLTITDAQGVVRYQSSDEPDAGLSWLQRAGIGVADASGARQSVSWRVDRAAGQHWTVAFTTLPESEEVEALSGLADLFVLMATCCVLMLVVMRWYIRRAFRPLTPLLSAIRRLEQQDLGAMRGLPTMPIRELESIASALRGLAQALAQAETARRVLAHQMLTLQEDERTRLAAELHDEFGQRLTALRVDAAWLARQLPDDDERRPVVVGMGGQVALIQQDVRGLLARLRPLAHEGELATFSRLRGLLVSLIDGWSRAGSGALEVELTLRHGGLATARRLDPVADAAWLDAVELPRGLVLAVYRITQEALTNVARHAGAQHAAIELRLELDDLQAGSDGWLHWCVADDGRGVSELHAAMQHGNGLAGMQERVWALGGEFLAADVAVPDTVMMAAGLRLQARLPFRLGGAAATRSTDDAGESLMPRALAELHDPSTLAPDPTPR